MFSKTILITAMIAYAEARFGQEQETQGIIAAVDGGNPGQAATIAGASISDLLGAASACAKLETADQIVADLGGGQDAIDAAIAHVAAEKNTNPSANGNAQKVCADPALPATEALRGITPLIDPAVDVDGGVAALSAQSQGAPLDATGKSVFDLLVEAGFQDLVVADGGAGGAAAGGAAAGGNANQGNANQGNANQGNANQGNANQGNADQGNDNANQNQGNNNADQNQGNNNAGNGQAADDAVDCNNGAADDVADDNTGNQNNNAGNQNANAGNQNNNADNQNNNMNNNQNAGNNNQNAGNNNDNAADGGAAAGAADFGQCTPTLVFEAGVNNRAADEFTFQIADPLARGGQSEALNPAIITNALCNQLTNVCEANDAAVAACRDAETQALALGTRDKAVADAFNTAIGFSGAVTNPSGGPADVMDLKKRGMKVLKFRA